MSTNNTIVTVSKVIAFRTATIAYESNRPENLRDIFRVDVVPANWDGKALGEIDFSRCNTIEETLAMSKEIQAWLGAACMGQNRHALRTIEAISQSKLADEAAEAAAEEAGTKYERMNQAEWFNNILRKTPGVDETYLLPVNADGSLNGLVQLPQTVYDSRGRSLVATVHTAVFEGKEKAEFTLPVTFKNGNTMIVKGTVSCPQTAGWFGVIAVNGQVSELEAIQEGYQSHFHQAVKCLSTGRGYRISTGAKTVNYKAEQLVKRAVMTTEQIKADRTRIHEKMGQAHTEKVTGKIQEKAGLLPTVEHETVKVEETGEIKDVAFAALSKPVALMVNGAAVVVSSCRDLEAIAGKYERRHLGRNGKVIDDNVTISIETNLKNIAVWAQTSQLISKSK